MKAAHSQNVVYIGARKPSGNFAWNSATQFPSSLRGFLIHKGPKLVHSFCGTVSHKIFTSPSPHRNTAVRLSTWMNDMIAHLNGFESVFIGGSVLTVERRSLMQSVFHAGDLINWPKGEIGTIPAPVLRSVILYCLAVNICSSEEIVDACESDPSVKYLCANYSLEWPIVHEFRKRSLIQIRDGLAHVFETALSIVPDPHLHAIARTEADRRIRRAVQADSSVLDL